LPKKIAKKIAKKDLPNKNLKIIIFPKTDFFAEKKKLQKIGFTYPKQIFLPKKKNCKKMFHLK